MAAIKRPRKLNRYSAEFKLKAVRVSQVEGVRVHDVADARDLRRLARLKALMGQFG